MNDVTGSALRIRFRPCALALVVTLAAVPNLSGQAPTNAPEVIAPSNVSMLRSRVLTRFQGNVKSLSSSANGKVLAVWTIGQDLGASVVDTTTGHTLTRIPSAQLPIALEAEGNFLASGPDASLWTGEYGWQHVVQSDHYAQPGSLRDIAFSPAESEDFVLAVATTQSTTIWAPPGQTRLGTDRVACDALALSKDSQLLACYGANSTLYIWNAMGGLTLLASKGLPALANNERLDLFQLGAVGPVQVDTSANRGTVRLGSIQVYIGTNRRTLRVSYSGQGGWTIKDLNIPVPLVAISPDGSVGVSVGNFAGQGSGGYSPLTLWDLTTSRPIAKKDNPDIPIAYTFSEDGRHLFCGTIDGEVVMWSVPSPGSRTRSTTAPTSRPTHASTTNEIPPNTVVMDEFNGSTVGQPYGITYVPTPFGEGAVFSRAADSRIEYRVPPEGTLEWWIRVSSGYNYSNFQLNAHQPQAMIFSTDAQGGDVTYPGAAKLFVYANGKVSLYIAISKYDKPPAPQVIAMETPFRFNQWHSIGISYGSQGEYIMVDGNLVASAQVGQLLDTAGNHQQPLDVPTIGETVSHFWGWHQYSGGFNGIVARFRASTDQRDWVLSASPPVSPQLSGSGSPCNNYQNCMKYGMIADPDWVAKVLREAVDLRSGGDIDGAVQKANEVLRVDPTNNAARTSIYESYVVGGRAEFRTPNNWGSAPGYFHDAINLDPSKPAAWVGLGRANMLLGRSQDMISAWNNALRLGGLIGFAVWHEVGIRYERGIFSMSASNVSFVNNNREIEFAVQPTAVEKIRAYKILGQNYVRLKVAGRNYNFFIVPFGAACQISAVIQCPTPGVAQEQIEDDYVAETIPKLASGALAPAPASASP